MKTKRYVLMWLVLISLLSWAASPAFAGSKHRNRDHNRNQQLVAGVAIGLGAAMLGYALIDHHHAHAVSEPGGNYPYSYNRPAGHWEIRREWVPPCHEQVWNSGHYSRRGRWVPGQWISIEKEPGYWRKERVWID